jgi:enterochelin esterase-like enzyme
VALQSLGFLLMLVAAAAALMAGVAYLWNRWPRPWSVSMRVVSLLLVMVMGALLAADVVNRQLGFYSSLADVFGAASTSEGVAGPQAPHPAAHVEIVWLDYLVRGRIAAASGHGLLMPVRYPGRRSGLSRDGYVYLPADYFRRSSLRYPAVEMLPGYPGGPGTWIHQLPVARVLDAEIAARRIPPLVAVFPRLYDHNDSECVDAVHGQANESYPSVDVVDDVVNTFRVLNSRSWGALGFSAGGFCAVNIGFHSPQRFAAVASLSGYFTAIQNRWTGDLYRGNRARRNRNSPLWWVEHAHPAGPALYLYAAAGDPPAVSQDADLAAATRLHAPGLPVQAVVTPGGGHNFGVWGAALAPALDWMAAYLPGPLAAPLVLQGQPTAPLPGPATSVPAASGPPPSGPAASGPPPSGPAPSGPAPSAPPRHVGGPTRLPPRLLAGATH